MNLIIVQICFAIISATIGLVMILRQDRMTAKSWFFELICLSSSLWIFSNVGINLSKSDDIAHLAMAIRGFGCVSTAVLTTLFVFELSDFQTKHKKNINLIIFLLSFVILMISFFGVERDYIQIGNLSYLIEKETIFTALCDLYTFGIFAFCIGLLVIWGFHTKFKREREQAFLLAICMIFGVGGYFFDEFKNNTTFANSFSQFSFVIILFYFSRTYNSLNITVGNFAGYIYSFASTPVFLLNPNYKVKLANNSAFSFFNMHSNELNGMHICDIFNFDCNFVECGIGESSNIDYEVSSKLNDKICNASVNKIFDRHGEIICTIIMVSDITEKLNIIKQLNESKIESEMASKAKSVFLANMSHEIRTPMNGVIGFAELALNDPTLSENARDCLEKIKTSGNGLLNIINDILDISKIEAGKMEHEIIPFSLHDIFKQCETISMAKASEKGIELFFYAEPNIEMKLLGDPTKLLQVILNLLTNAIKFTSKGSVKLMAAAGEAYESNGEKHMFIHFEIKDTGIGMSPEQTKIIFEPFEQADSSTTRKYGGTGLGLAIAKNLVELMGGELKVQSTPEVGTKFYFDLDFKLIDIPDIIEEVPKVLLNIFEVPVFEGDVLVCEDNEINQQVIRGHLLRFGLTPTIVANGKLGVEEVVERAKLGQHFDLIFMDIHMPIMDGLEATHLILEMNTPTPIVALTANAMAKDKADYLKQGMSDYLAKPFVSEDLYLCLKRYLKYLGTITIAPPKTLDNANSSSIDKKSGLARTAYDEDLYNKICKGFLHSWKDVHKQLRLLLDSEDLVAAHRTAHTLKSISANIGAQKLSDIAKEIEHIIGEEPHLSDQLDGLLLALQAENKIVCEELLLGESDKVQTEELSEFKFDKNYAIQFIEELRQLLEDGDSRCINMTEQIKKILSPVGEKSKTLTEQIVDIDFDMALDTLKDISTLVEVLE